MRLGRIRPQAVIVPARGVARFRSWVERCSLRNRGSEEVRELSETVGALLIVAAVAAFFLASAIWLRYLDSQVHVGGHILPSNEEHEATHPLRVEGELSPVPHGHHVWLAFEAVSYTHLTLPTILR